MVLPHRDVAQPRSVAQRVYCVACTGMCPSSQRSGFIGGSCDAPHDPARTATAPKTAAFGKSSAAEEKDASMPPSVPHMYAGTAIAIMELATSGPATYPVTKMPPIAKPAVSCARDPGFTSVRGAMTIKMRSVSDRASNTAWSCLCNAEESSYGR